MTLSYTQFQQISFMNCIMAKNGGEHVNYVTDKIVTFIIEEVWDKAKIKIKPNYIKQYLWIFVNCVIENPVFDSKTKDTLISKQEDFGIKFDFSNTFLNKVLNSQIVDRCIKYAKIIKKGQNIRKLEKKKKKTRLLYYKNLNDANLADNEDSKKCTLIITSGDATKWVAMTDIEILGRDLFGCYSIKDKITNIRHCTHQEILKNQEIKQIIKILGAKFKKNHFNTKHLRYGSILLILDRDEIGIYTTGLILNMINYLFPKLFRLEGFINLFIPPIPPIIRATKKKK